MRLLGLLVAACLIGACSPDDGGAPDGGDTTDPTVTAAPTGTTDTTETTDDGTVVSADGFPTTDIVEPDASGLPSLEDDPDTVRGRLGNGLTYYLRSNDNPGGSVSMRLAVDAGSALQEPDQVGVAHFLEHMLFNGTEQFPDNELTAVLRSFGAAFGADINAYTSSDETVYELTMPNDGEVVDTGLDVLHQWLTAATIDPDQVIAERGVVLDEFRLSEGSVDGRAFTAIDHLFLDGSVYEGQQPIGTAEAISAMTDEPLRRFYDTWYRPDNAAIVVVGDIDVEDVEQGIIERFATATARGDAPPRPDLGIDPSAEPLARLFSDPDLTSGYAFVTLPLARAEGIGLEALTQRDLLDELAFDIIATRLSDDALRGDAPFRSASATSSSFVRPLDAPEISVEVSGDGVAASVSAILDEYERVRRFGFTDAELARGSTRCAASTRPPSTARDRGRTPSSPTRSWPTSSTIKAWQLPSVSTSSWRPCSTPPHPRRWRGCSWIAGSGQLRTSSSACPRARPSIRRRRTSWWRSSSRRPLARSSRG